MPEHARADQYRFHVADRVPFSQSLEVKVETLYVWAPSTWQSVAFWYQLPSSATSAPLPTGRAGLELEIGPNPIRDAVRIRFTLPAAAATTVEVLDVRGRRVEVIAERRFEAGPHEMSWSRGGAASGVYFLRVLAGDLRDTRKVVLSP